MDKVKKGRDFEKLVAEIERAFSGSTAKIKINDRIPDIETGTLREIDISIRAKVGSMDLLTIVECRDRNHKADSRWIEELDGKRKSVGAHKVVAVSRNGFTDEAITKAKIRNIETRTLRKLKQRQIREWIDAHPMSLHHTEWKQIEGEFIFRDDTLDASDLFKNIRWHDDAGIPLPLFMRKNDDRLINVVELFRWAYWLVNGAEPETGIGVEPVNRRVETGFSPGGLKLPFHDFEYDIAGIRLGFEIRLTNIPLQSVEQYSSDENGIATKVVWGDDIKIGGKSVSMNFEVMFSASLPQEDHNA